MSRRPPRRRSALAVVAASALVSLGSLLGSASATAIDPLRTTIDATGRIGAAGKSVRVDGRVQCARCGRFVLGITLSQRASGALAQGGVRCVCRAAAERWSVTTRVREADPFRPGSARACGWVVAHATTGVALDAYQWCENITLRAA